MTAHDDYFPLLDLPAGKFSCRLTPQCMLITRLELRNRIYDFAATKADSDRCCVLPGLALALTCRQLRAEYLPICRQALVTIDWNDVPRYFNAWYPSVAGQLQNIELAPPSITILVTGLSLDQLSSQTRDLEIDILSLVKMRLGKPGFSCRFQRNPALPYHEDEDRAAEQRLYLKADTTMLLALIYHNNQRWSDNVQSGKVPELRVEPIGGEEPTVYFKVDDEEEKFYLDDDGEYDGDGFEGRYLKKTQLEHVWRCNIDGESFKMDYNIQHAKPLPTIDPKGEEKNVADSASTE
jgi:hypothetical protein